MEYHAKHLHHYFRPVALKMRGTFLAAAKFDDLCYDVHRGSIDRTIIANYVLIPLNLTQCLVNYYTT